MHLSLSQIKSLFTPMMQISRLLYFPAENKNMYIISFSNVNFLVFGTAPTVILKRGHKFVSCSVLPEKQDSLLFVWMPVCVVSEGNSHKYKP